MHLHSTAPLVALALLACGDSGSTPAGGAGGDGAGGDGAGGVGAGGVVGGNGGQPSAGSPSIGGAGGSGEGGSGGGQAGVNGSAGKGPLISGSSILISVLDGAGEPTGAIFSSTISNALGHFSVPVNVSGPARIEANGFFFNEILGGLSSAPISLRALVDVDGTMAQTVNLNTLTHLTQRRAFALWQAGETLADARDQAYAELIASFELGAPGFVPGTDAADASLVDGDDDDAAYLLAVSSIAIDVATLVADGGPVEPALTLWLDQIATDLEDDGNLTNEHKLEIHDSEARIDGDAIVSALGAYLVQQGSAATVPNIHRALDQDFDGQANIDDCLPLDPLRWTGNADLDLDTHDDIACGGGDCDDDLSAISPDATDSVGDATDNNCDGVDGVDTDGDLLASIASGGADCDDTDPTVGPPWQPTITVDKLAMDASGNRYGYENTGTLWTDSSGTWMSSSAPVGPYSWLLAEPDGVLHLVSPSSHQVYAGGVWTAAAAPAPSADIQNMVVDDGGALHYLRGGEGAAVYYGTDASGAFVETQLAVLNSWIFGIDLDSLGNPVVCYSDQTGLLICRNPTGSNIFTAGDLPPFGARSMAIADDGTIHLARAYLNNVYGASWNGTTFSSFSTVYAAPVPFFPKTSLTTVGNDVWLAVYAIISPLTFTNAAGTWESLPITTASASTPCALYSGGGEITLLCGSVLELNSGCAL